MRRILLIFTIPLLISCNAKQNKISEDTLAQEHLVYATIWFQCSPEAAALYQQGFNLATERVAEFSQTKGTKPKAVVVDIDETMVNNSPFQGKSIKTGTSYTFDFWKQWSDMACATALPGAVDFSQFCDSLGVQVFYISNRRAEELTNTMKNLDSLGFAFVKPENFLLRVESGGKEKRRENVAEKFDIILLLGDNLNDFSEVFESRGDDWGLGLVERYKKEFGRRFIIFPNPMYGDWEKNVYGLGRDQTKDEMFLKRRNAIKSF